MGIHPRGAVHRREHPPPDDDSGQARRQARRHADGDRDAGRVEHRRLWRPRRRNADRPRSAIRSRCIAAPTRRRSAMPSTPTWCPRGGFRGYGASQTTFAIESAIDELAHLLGMTPLAMRRKNMIRARRLDRVGLERSNRCPVRQLRARPMPRSGGKRDASGRRRCRNLPETNGWKAPAWRSQCWIAGRQPNIAPPRP